MNHVHEQRAAELNERPALARSSLDRAAFRRADPQWLADAWLRAMVVVIGPDNRALVRGSELVLLSSSDTREHPAGDPLFLGVEPDGTPYFAVRGLLQLIEGAEPKHLYEVGADLTERDAGLFTQALALVGWHRDHLFAPKSGQPTTVEQGGWVRRDAEGELHFPRTDPAVIMIVHDGVAGPQGRALLGANVMWATADKRRYSTLAGFVEAGESAESAVIREVAEECGVTVADPVYVGSQPWPYPRSLMLGFTVQGDPAEPIRTDPEELVDARWFTRTEIAAVLDGSDDSFGLPNRSSIASHLIRRWLDGR
ncbi:putative NADH pyrophosphatase/NUDIX hydrolase [Catellatospora sp. TT07R-123]|uniref:NAD(+) diphosphatase n=1 Tax=Catellatospora sp. TT07R-123 TaxID=2733863 RepID=UPI001B27C478|nr:NAD(+) diphosphatase [Catellatospora sp. TT07R-123]GHJ50195.1 putative NADH pyrophosphatase/NUDIX hydrolase [Catellatospora sp. TT07R-123]